MMTGKGKIGYAWMLMAVALVIVGGMACGPQQFKSPMFQPNDNLGFGPNGLAWNGRDLVIGDDRMFLEVNSISTGWYHGEKSAFTNDGYYSYARIPLPIPSVEPIRICGLAWEGECCGKGFLWIADSNNKEILKLDPTNKILVHFPAPGDSPKGLAFDGKDLWVGDTASSRIYRVSAEDGTVLAEYISPIKEPMELAWDCGSLWIVGLDTCKIPSKACYTSRLVKMDVQRGRVTHEIALPKYIVRPSALEWVDGILWVGDYTLNRIFKISASGSEITDDTVYTTAITARPRKLAAKERPAGGDAKEQAPLTRTSPRESKPSVADSRDAARDAATAASAAKAAAEEAKRAAEEAKESAKKSEKAFDLNQKK